MYLITAHWLYGYSYRPRCHQPSQSQLILAISIELVGRAAPLPGSLFHSFLRAQSRQAVVPEAQAKL
jgi:hypothetical protein